MLYCPVTVGCCQVPVETTKERSNLEPSKAEVCWLDKLTSIQRSFLLTLEGIEGTSETDSGVSVGEGVSVGTGVGVSVGVSVGVGEGV